MAGVTDHHRAAFVAPVLAAVHLIQRHAWTWFKVAAATFLCVYALYAAATVTGAIARLALALFAIAMGSAAILTMLFAPARTPSEDIRVGTVRSRSLGSPRGDRPLGPSVPPTPPAGRAQ